MTQATLDTIHFAYNQALMKSNNLMEIIQNLYKILDETEVNEVDSDTFDSFLDGLRACIRTRAQTFAITNMATYINITLMYIVLWLNFTKGKCIDASFYARRKALESDLTKILQKCNSTTSVNIRDRFGIRGIIWNEESENENVKILFEISESIFGILGGKNRKMTKEFKEWLENQKQINDIDKMIVKKVLEIPFGIDYIKDYVSNPKPNGYMTYQFTLITQMYSSVLPGCMIEFQLRTKAMHEEALHGKAAHEKYKRGGLEEEELTEEMKAMLEVFKVDDFSKIHIPGFTGYGGKEQDCDGIHIAKDFFDRRLSSTLVKDLT